MGSFIDKVVPVLVGKRTEVCAAVATALVLAESLGLLPAGSVDKAGQATATVCAALAAVFAAARSQR